MSQTTAIPKNQIAVGSIVAILVLSIVSVGVASEFIVNAQKTGVETSGPSEISANGSGMGNLVQVSGTIHAVQNGTIIFFDSNDIYSSDVTVSGNITNGQYSVLLVGGKSYNVETDKAGYYLLYVPTDVTTFNVNF